ncbi:aldo/keto reductase [Myceligenerans crystallogenes]|uniref:Aldo/keto reductase n=1 Tax=Myceligenerans crystallogenes TaxID=316335 RepID=A0ABN2NII2_9MICO
MGVTGLRVSELGLGTMTWGRETDDLDAAEQVRDFLDAGGNLIDTAASYGDGEAESVIGTLLGGKVSRGEVVLATKAGTRRDASRRTLLDALDASLRRMGTDHVDLFLVACPDGATPLAETASALRLAVTSGKARYAGVCNHPGWATARLASLVGDDAGLAAVSCEYSLVQRGVEREILPAAHELGLGLLAWSPLGRGVLTGKYRHGTPADSRAASSHMAGFVQPYLEGPASSVVDAVGIAADGLGRSPAEVALSWLLEREQVASAIVGARTPAQLRTTLAATELALPAEVLSALDDVSAPPVGYPERW